MACNYCGTTVDLVERDLHVKNGDIKIEKILVCQRCLKKYNTILFDSCDNCNELYEMHVNVFHLIDGKIYCPTCKDNYITKK